MNKKKKSFIVKLYAKFIVSLLPKLIFLFALSSLLDKVDSRFSKLCMNDPAEINQFSIVPVSEWTTVFVDGLK